MARLEHGCLAMINNQHLYPPCRDIYFAAQTNPMRPFLHSKWNLITCIRDSTEVMQIGGCKKKHQHTSCSMSDRRIYFSHPLLVLYPWNIYLNSLPPPLNTGNRLHHLILHQKVGWPSLLVDQRTALFFVYKALLCKLPSYLTWLLNCRHASHQTLSQGRLTLEIPSISTELGRFALIPPHMWNELQSTPTFEKLMPLGQGYSTIIL